jgi:tRNA(fMet)-specific endonuclease VapC
MALIYLPDTNAWIGYLRGKDAALVQHFLQAGAENLRLCSIVLGELIYGAYYGPISYLAHNLALIARLRQQFTSIPFDDRGAEEYGQIRAHLAALGTLIGPNDLLIAAIARSNGLTLVTQNTAEFRRVPGLNLEDWQ